MTTIHNGTTGEQVAGPLTGPGIMGISPTGVLVGAAGGDITQYDLDTLEPIGTFAGARGEVNSLQFSANGAVLLATANDQTVAVYDVAGRTRLGDPIPTSAPFILPGWLRPDGAVLASTDKTGVATWDLDTEQHAAAGCRLAGRNLSATEWATYLGDLGPYRSTCPQFPPGN